jgi:hypothetical protein
VALLSFPSAPLNGQLYPINPLVDQYQYKWSAADLTWRLLGAATGVTPGVYCAGNTFAPKITVDALGRITFAECVELTGFVKTNNTSAYNSYIWPNVDGTAGQVLATDGAGGLAWVTVSGGGGGPGTVTFVGAGTGLSVVGGGAITTAGTIRLNPATTLTLGGVRPDGTTITISPAGVISASATPPGLGLTVSGGFTKVAVPIALTPPVAGTGQLQAVPGSLYWDSALGELFIYYDDGVTAQWISTTGGAPPAAGYGIKLESFAYKSSIPSFTNPPTVSTAPGDATDGSLYYDTDLGVLFYLYNDGVSRQWVQV